MKKQNITAEVTVKEINKFIEFFESIPEEQWRMGWFINKERTQCCALGHCTYTTIKNGKAIISNKDINVWGYKAARLKFIFDTELSADVGQINDGNWSTTIGTPKGKTPKLRILNALQEIKSKILIREGKEKYNCENKEQIVI